MSEFSDFSLGKKKNNVKKQNLSKQISCVILYIIAKI